MFFDRFLYMETMHGAKSKKKNQVESTPNDFYYSTVSFKNAQNSYLPRKIPK